MDEKDKDKAKQQYFCTREAGCWQCLARPAGQWASNYASNANEKQVFPFSVAKVAMFT